MSLRQAVCTITASAGLWLVLTDAGHADAPVQSIRPELRPGTEAVAATLAPAAPATVAPAVDPRVSEEAVAASPRPDQRPRNIGEIIRAALRNPKPDAKPDAKPDKAAVQPKRGSVCGDRAIRGSEIARIPGKLKGCGVANPVRITEVGGVKLSMAATVNCTTAKALKTWIDKTVKPTVGGKGGGVVSLRVAAHYSCRTRNNIPGAKVSEHGKGNAIDISAINLKNGTSITVLGDWGKGADGRVLRKLHAGACGPFGTVLGPNSDRFHKDHFHFDVARHRSGAYCK